MDHTCGQYLCSHVNRAQQNGRCPFRRRILGKSRRLTRHLCRYLLSFRKMHRRISQHSSRALLREHIRWGYRSCIMFRANGARHPRPQWQYRYRYVDEIQSISRQIEAYHLLVAELGQCNIWKRSRCEDFLSYCRSSMSDDGIWSWCHGKWYVFLVEGAWVAYTNGMIRLEIQNYLCSTRPLLVLKQRKSSWYWIHGNGKDTRRSTVSEIGWVGRYWETGAHKEFDRPWGLVSSYLISCLWWIIALSRCGWSKAPISSTWWKY